MSSQSSEKFDPARAAEYEKQSRIGLAGYDACHELCACMLAAALGSGSMATILVGGAGGTASEITTAGQLEPNWSFVAVDPSRPMLDLAAARVADAGLASRTRIVHGQISDLSSVETFDAATLIGVLHHLPGDDAKRNILQDIALRMKPGAPLVLAGNHYTYSEEPLRLKAWGERWRMNGASDSEVKAKLGKILQGADPPPSEEAVAVLLAHAGFEPPQRFFSSLFWGAWITFKR